MDNQPWYLVTAKDQVGALFIEIRTPASTLPDALRIACAHVDNQVRVRRSGDPSVSIEVRPL